MSAGNSARNEDHSAYLSMLKTHTPYCYCGFSILSISLFPLPRSHRFFHSLLFPDNKRNQLETLTQCAELS